jgi:hypothetical protein
MEHAEAREVLEIAALEPGGFERLAAGDTPEAAALAGHIAGCLVCSAEMERLRRASIVIREAVRTSPPPELRERTLAFVAAVGRPRGTPEAPSDIHPAQDTRRTGPGIGRLIAAIAAAVAIAVVGTTLVLERSRDSVIQAQATQLAALSKVATWSLRIDGQPDARYVELAATNGPPDLKGSLAFAPTTKELVVLAEGLAQPPSGLQYRCWVEIDGSRRRIGQMFFAGDVAFWVGEVDEISAAAPGTRFGVSLVPADGDSLSGDPVLLGEL